MVRAVRAGSFLLLAIVLFLAAWIIFFPERPETHALTPAPASIQTVPPETPEPPIPLPSVEPVSIDAGVPEIIHPKSGRYVAAWMPTDWDTDDTRASFEANLDYIDEISPVWYEMRSDGTLRVLGSGQDDTLVDAAHAAGVLVLPSITNGFDPERTGYVMRDPERRSGFVRRLLDEIEEYGYDGIDIDFEGMPDSQRDVFTAFIRELADGLHQRGKVLAIAIHARTGDEGGALGAQAQDWYAIGQAVDRFRIMTYDYHWSGGGPGPVAPIYWCQEVMEYAKTRVDPAKIELGVPFYGYDWTSTDGWPVTWIEIQELIDLYQPKVSLVERDSEGEVAESTFTYRDRQGLHTIWYASRRSLEAKLDLVKEYDLAGIAIWRLGGEDPEYWDAIHEKLARDPYEVQRSIVRYLPNP